VGHTTQAQSKFADVTVRVQGPLKLKTIFHVNLLVFACFSDSFLAVRSASFIPSKNGTLKKSQYFLVNRPNTINFACQN
jgi:hypothetical protein